MPAHPTRVIAAVTGDLVLFAVGAVVAFVFVTGGRAYIVDGSRISVTDTGHPMILAALVAAVRYRWLRDVPLLARSSVTIADLEQRAPGLLRRGRTLLLVAIALSAFLRLVSAWAHPGFVAGDDVEIHEMTLVALLGFESNVWTLRNAFYPMTFIYPAQLVAHRLGVTDIGTLVFAGRLAVVALATLTIWLVYRIAYRLTGSMGAGGLAALFVATSRLHLWFGSSELPRPVAAVFITSAFLLLLDRGRWRTAAAGVLLGVGGSLRFGELVFFVPAGLQLLLERRFADVVRLSVTGIATAAVCLGGADWLYWDQPFFSLRNAIEYTILEQQSSRGFQPPWYYLADFGSWTNPVVLGLALLAVPVDRRVALWAWLPVFFLSALPHKEARYLVAVQPFFCVAAAIAVHAVVENRYRRLRPGVIAGAVVLALVFEVTNWRLRRSDDEIALARTISHTQPRGVAAHQLWRFGGRPYWTGVESFLELPAAAGDFARLTAAGIDTVVLARDRVDPGSERELMSRGFMRDEALSTARYVVFRLEPEAT